jgi:hypothetical protein
MLIQDYLIIGLLFLMFCTMLMVISIFKLGYEMRKKLNELDKMKIQFKELMTIIEVTI